MVHSPLVQRFFLLGSLGLIGYFVWQLILPFFAALMIALIVVVVSYPMYERLVYWLPRRNQTVAALLSTILALFLIILPLYILSSLLASEFLAILEQFDTSSSGLAAAFNTFESAIEVYVPGVDLNLVSQIQQSAQWITRNLGGFFSGTVSLIISTLVAVLGIFYLFRDGARFQRWLIDVSPLPDDQDRLVVNRVATAIRSVAVGTILISIIQGVVATIGFTIFGIERALLWGAVGAFGALLPGIGLAGIMVPAVAFLFFTGQTTFAVGLLIYAVVVIAVVDNLIAPYLLSRGSNLHPFVILLSVLGGITVFGPIGFVLGPIIVSLFLALVDLYANVEVVKLPNNKSKAKAS